MNPSTTHIIQTYTSKEGHSCGDLFRRSDGMLIGRFLDDVVIYGEDPNQSAISQRVFIDTSHAKAFLRTRADADAGQTAYIHEEPRPHKLVLTPQQMTQHVRKH